MPVYFNFTSTDSWLRDKKYGLPGSVLKAITVWQDTALDYDFSFHELHTAGHPVYVCKTDGHGGRNMPKIDTFEKSADELDFVNKDKLLKTQREDALKVVRANLEAFNILTEKYYGGVENKVEKKVEIATLSCKQCKADITHVKPVKNKRVCPNCSKWN